MSIILEVPKWNPVLCLEIVDQRKGFSVVLVHKYKVIVVWMLKSREEQEPSTRAKFV